MDKERGWISFYYFPRRVINSVGITSGSVHLCVFLGIKQVEEGEWQLRLEIKLDVERQNKETEKSVEENI